MPSAPFQVGIRSDSSLPSSFDDKRQRALLWISFWPDTLDPISAEQEPLRRVNSKPSLYGILSFILCEETD